EQDGGHGGRDPGADRGHIGFDELHGVIDAQTGIDAPPRGIDIDLDVLGGIGTGQKEQLCLDYIGHLIVDPRAQKDDAVHHQAGEDVHGDGVQLPFLDDVRGHIHRIHAAHDLIVIHGVYTVVPGSVFFEFFSVIHGV